MKLTDKNVEAIISVLRDIVSRSSGGSFEGGYKIYRNSILTLIKLLEELE